MVRILAHHTTHLMDTRNNGQTDKTAIDSNRQLHPQPEGQTLSSANHFAMCMECPP